MYLYRFCRSSRRLLRPLLQLRNNSIAQTRASMPAPQPELPHPAHIDHDSALGRKFGKETTNYFGSEKLE